MYIRRRRSKVMLWCLSLALGVKLMFGFGLAVGAEEKVFLRWIDWGDPTQMKANEEIKKRFEKMYPEIEIQLEYTAGDWATKLLAQMAAGTAPDVITGWSEYTREWVERNQLLDLTPYIEQYMTPEEIDDYYVSQLNAFWYEGIQFGLPKYVSSTALFYNKNMFDEAGVEYPKKETWTWDTLLQTAQRLTKREKDRISQYGFYAIAPLWFEWYFPWVWQNGGEVFNVEDNRVCLLDEPEAVAATQFLQDLVWKYRVSPVPAEVGGRSHEEAFMARQAAMMRSGPWFVATLPDRKVDFDWDVCLLAKGKKRVGLHFIDCYGIWKGTKHPDEAFKLVHYASGVESAEILMKEVGMQPAHKSLVNSFVDLFPQYDMEAFVEIMNYARPSPLFRNHIKTLELLIPALERIITLNKQTAEEGLKEVVPKINEMLSKYPKALTR